MGWYQKKILPRLLDSTMSGEEIEKLRPAVVGEAKGVVLEIGAGSGLNLPFYHDISKLIALEPSQELATMARERAQDVAFAVEFMQASAEHIPLPDASVDTAVSTWTLCSIGRPLVALREMRRVLKPDGRFLFIDHGISPRPILRTVQKLLTPILKPFSGGCHLNRDIPALIESAGFTIIQKDQFHEKSHPLIYNTRGAARLS